ncbi:MAG: Single-stranded-DNA-specific exonuclease RecJ [Candidatus Magasanikbacteria bacterium GW2011_GWC2_40_17]|uniref:Single-stranded-DNA-specific exonuclease RecJ n=1 Tax=Candidatus Magasanikbacteria bacterium GW2011_GWA2_42_32 TaxID=1619039 RepID=A0A0G1A7C0_9BACT|nr:MAG: Single-stranded-DNA-specific exonuclease RecJ [Candidatus Magasanikbacteria bacterium GW2011_GWC2_40_17]KKS56920.1 MAG: Single-stranded-DNA-specific exonuclease RecJ [Candidatus Magasanikbacteria bacterium GW2011_GWA2_42_32]OGH85510.1 MAG: single-stranded-DNA-specific exonuclease RecJ [Candidatus Magasanikbacteria bacterium RIFOXYB2_FULL_38_10]
MQKIWRVAESLTEEFKKQFPEIPEVVLQLLHNRNLLTQEKIDEFLYPDYSQDVFDPYLFKDMVSAVNRIFQAIEKNELIIVHGDYDADGVCASVILISTLKALGAKRVDVFLPDRDLDGYGINKNTIEIIASAGAKLLLSCDCGISNKEEISLAQSKGVDVIITDHHNVPETLPPAVAIIHPKVPGETYPDKGLSGGGVAFKLVQALLKDKRAAAHWQIKDTREMHEKWLLDLVAISSVADMVPLLGESRTLTKYGLIVLNKTKRIGLKELLEICGLNKNQENKDNSRRLFTSDIGFKIAPRINAAGRVKHANGAFQLLNTEDKDEAKELARELNVNNQERQQITEKMVNEAKLQIKETDQTNEPIIFVIKKDWPVGLIGLIASRLCNEFYKPVIIMTDKDGQIHGSGRSIEEINIMEKMIELNELFSKYGGHPQACGFTLKNSRAETLKKFESLFLEMVKKEVINKKIIPVLKIDTEVKLEDVNWDSYDLLQKFEPFGQNNPEPKYLAKNLTIASVEPVGNNGRHLKLLVRQHTFEHRKMIGFCFGDENIKGQNWCQVLKPGDSVDAVFEVSVNEWNGNRELQLKLVDLKLNQPIQ